MRGYKDKNGGVNQRCEPRIGLIENRYRMDSMRLNMSAFGSVARQRKQGEINCKTTTSHIVITTLVLSLGVPCHDFRLCGQSWLRDCSQ